RAPGSSGGAKERHGLGARSRSARKAAVESSTRRQARTGNDYFRRRGRRPECLLRIAQRRNRGGLAEDRREEVVYSAAGATAGRPFPGTDRGAHGDSGRGVLRRMG